MNDILTPQMRAAIAANCNTIFADVNATSDQVLEAMISYLTMNNIQFHTASGEIALHLQNGAQAIKAQRAMAQNNVRRYLGMERIPAEPKGQDADGT